MKEKQSVGNFTEGNIFPKLLRFMIPVFGALVLQAMYGAVDLLMVGWFGTTAGISAVSTGSNIINLVSEAVALSAILQLPNVKALGDTYHMAMCSEPLGALTMAGPLLAHVHTANALGRVLPKAGDGEDYPAIFRALKAAGYEGRVSCEASFQDFEADALAAFQVLDACRRAEA